MIVVVQCAATKRVGAGFLRTQDGRKVLFVANPADAPPSSELVYARPDDPCDTHMTWREALLEYNRNPGTNPLGLYAAAELYANPTYGLLVKQFGTDRTYILSAGWGLIGASLLTPCYDITFSMVAEQYKRRREGESYRDLRLPPMVAPEPIVFFGGKDYVALFCDLTKEAKGERTVFYNSSRAPHAPGCSLERYVTTTRTNWHYECATKFAAQAKTAAQCEDQS